MTSADGSATREAASPDAGVAAGVANSDAGAVDDAALAADAPEAPADGSDLQPDALATADAPAEFDAPESEVAIAEDAPGAQDAPLAEAAAAALVDASPDADEDAAAAADVALDQASADAPAVDAPTGSTLIGYWVFDDGSGTVANDLSSNANHLNVQDTAAPMWVSGRRGGALYLANGAWGRAAAPSQLVSTDKFSVVVWIQRTRSVTGHEFMLDWQWDTTRDAQIALLLEGNAPKFSIARQLNGTNTCTAAMAVPLNTWTHLAGTYDGSVGRLYVNGTEVCSFSFTYAFQSSSNPLFIGANNNSSRLAPTEHFVGPLDDLVLYARALSAAEVEAIAVGQVPPTW